MKKALLVTVFAGLFIAQPGFAQEDEEETVYSTEGYCVLANEGVQEDYLRAYAKKLGSKPSLKVCNGFKDIVSESRPKEWDFRGGKPYPGSAIRLTAKQIELIKASKK